jgi:uncharacterized membrane protein YgcG
MSIRNQGWFGRIFAALIIGIIAWGFFATGTAQEVGINLLSAKRFHFPHVRIEAVVGSDGHMHVTETRQWQFRGEYSWVEQWINHSDTVFLSDVTFGEPGRPYTEGSGLTAGTYKVSKRVGGTAIRWSFNAHDETRTFVLSYTANNAVRAHDDVAELYWQFIGDDWEVPTDKAEVHLRLPAGAGELRAWGHGPLQGRVTPGPGDTVTWDVTEMRPGRMLEGRVLFDLASVPGAERRTGRAMLAEIVAEEAGWAAEANRARQLARIDLILAIAAGPLGLLIVGRFWWRHGRHPKPDWSGPYFRELPGNYTPADLGLLLYRDVKKQLGPILSATVLDLGRRGHLELQPVVGQSRRSHDLTIRKGTPPEADTLLPHERHLLTFLFGEVAEDVGDVTVSALGRWMRKHEMRTRLFVTELNSRLQTRREELGFWADKSGRWFRRFLLIGSIILMWLLGSEPLLFYWSKYPLWPLAGIGALLSVFAYRRSQYGSDQKARWAGFKRFLLHFSRLDLAEVPAVVLWEHYLVFATVLGVAAKVLKQMKEVLPRLPEDQRFYDTPIFAHDTGFASFDSDRLDTLGSLAAMTEQSFTSAIRSSTESSSDGGGGGFSSGGGGGDGGGGGRAG